MPSAPPPAACTTTTPPLPWRRRSRSTRFAPSGSIRMMFVGITQCRRSQRSKKIFSPKGNKVVTSMKTMPQSHLIWEQGETEAANGFDVIALKRGTLVWLEKSLLRHNYHRLLTRNQVMSLADTRTNNHLMTEGGNQAVPVSDGGSNKKTTTITSSSN